MRWRKLVVHQHAARAAPATSEAAQPEAAALAALYSFVDGERVVAFLASAPFLVPLLSEAAAVIRRHFDAASLSLEVVDDPDLEHDRQLALVIATPLAPEKASERLQRFDDAWWLERLPLAHDRLFVTLAFA